MNINEALNVLAVETITITKEELKKAYKRAAQKYHPDRNPQGEQMMKIINEAYDFLKNLDIETITRTQNKNNEFDIYDLGEQLNEVLNKLAQYTDLSIEVIGNWLWISGNTKEYKEILKELKCKWAPKKQLWYFRPEEHMSRNRNEWTIDQVRDNYGSWKYKNSPKAMLQGA